MASQNNQAYDFAFLTAKQAAVLDLLANHRTSKEMAHTLGISETAVNRRIESVRQRLGGISRPELARRYSDWTAIHDPSRTSAKPLERADTPCVENRTNILPLADLAPDGNAPSRDGEETSTTFHDPVAMSIEAPWKEWQEPRIVPRVLDGENATLARGAAIAILLVAIIASLVLALAAAQALADAVS
jgi:DNA-binding CsgD family transcriptional regulator